MSRLAPITVRLLVWMCLLAVLGVAVLGADRGVASARTGVDVSAQAATDTAAEADTTSTSQAESTDGTRPLRILAILLGVLALLIGRLTYFYWAATKPAARRGYLPEPGVTRSRDKYI